MCYRFYLSINDRKRAATREMGPNNARRVIWALHTCFFFIFRVFVTKVCFFLFLSHFYILTNNIIIIFRFIKETGKVGWVAAVTTSPNDARRVVWAKGMYFLYLFRVLFNLTDAFCFYLGSIEVLKGRGGLEWAAVTKTGPNNARPVVWALCTCFFFFHVFL